MPNDWNRVLKINNYQFIFCDSRYSVNKFSKYHHRISAMHNKAQNNRKIISFAYFLQNRESRRRVHQRNSQYNCVFLVQDETNDQWFQYSEENEDNIEGQYIFRQKKSLWEKKVWEIGREGRSMFFFVK